MTFLSLKKTCLVRILHTKVKAAADKNLTPAAAPFPAEEPSSPTTQKGPSSLAKRATFGSILGLGGAVVIVLGGWLFASVACLVAYQCSQEFIGLVNAKGISEGMKPPPPMISSAISMLCVALCAWSFVSGGKMASAMAVATFLVLSLQLVASQKPRFSQLTSAVFGLLYCGMPQVSHLTSYYLIAWNCLKSVLQSIYLSLQVTSQASGLSCVLSPFQQSIVVLYSRGRQVSPPNLS